MFEAAGETIQDAKDVVQVNGAVQVSVAVEDGRVVALTVDTLVLGAEQRIVTSHVVETLDAEAVFLDADLLC